MVYIQMHKWCGKNNHYYTQRIFKTGYIMWIWPDQTGDENVSNREERNHHWSFANYNTTIVVPKCSKFHYLFVCNVYISKHLRITWLPEIVYLPADYEHISHYFKWITLKQHWIVLQWRIRFNFLNLIAFTTL